MKCKNCGADVSEDEGRCPYCDSPLPVFIEENEIEEEVEEAEEEEENEEEVDNDAGADDESAYQISEEELEEKISARVESELAARRQDEDSGSGSGEGLSPLSWIGGVIWCIIGFCCGILPGIGVIFILGAAHEGPGFWRSFLRVMNVILYAGIALIVAGVITETL